VHSAVAWSAGKLLRTTGGSLDGDTSTLDLARDQQLANDLGTLGTELGQFTTALGIALPFASGDQIITFPPVKLSLDMNADSDVLRQSAIRLYGNDWHENLARVLNRHPEKPPGEVPTGLIVEWASGNRRPPLWVLTALSELLVAQIASDDEHEADFRMLFEAVKARIKRALGEGWDGSGGVKISVVGPEAGLLTEMINSRPTEALTLGPGVKIIWRVPFGKDAQGLSVIDVVIFLGETLVPSVVASLIAEWIMSKFRGRAERLIINKKECEFDQGKIAKIVEETIQYERE
jgi:hypothetical protein